MKRTALTLACCTAVLGLATLALAQADSTAQSPITGTWQCLSHGGENGDMQFTLTLNQDGESVTGSVDSPMGGADISKGSFKEDKLSIEIATDEDNYVLTATLDDGQLKGEWTHGQNKGTWEGKKGSPESQSPSQTTPQP
jgi:hypothetical protein